MAVTVERGKDVRGKLRLESVDLTAHMRLMRLRSQE